MQFENVVHFKNFNFKLSVNVCEILKSVKRGPEVFFFKQKKNVSKSVH